MKNLITLSASAYVTARQVMAIVKPLAKSAWQLLDILIAVAYWLFLVAQDKLESHVADQLAEPALEPANEPTSEYELLAVLLDELDELELELDLDDAQDLFQELAAELDLDEPNDQVLYQQLVDNLDYVSVPGKVIAQWKVSNLGVPEVPEMTNDVTAQPEN